jgi:hypothetical protein
VNAKFISPWATKAAIGQFFCRYCFSFFDLGDPICWNEENERSKERRNGRKVTKKKRGKTYPLKTGWDKLLLGCGWPKVFFKNCLATMGLLDWPIGSPQKKNWSNFGHFLNRHIDFGK